MNTTNTPFRPEELLAHRTWVRSLARSLVRDEHAAADLEQDTWVKVLESPPSRRESERGWLGTVLRNRHRDTHRMDTRRAARERASRPLRATDGPVEMAARAELQRRVIEHVLALDEPYRATVLYRFFEGLTPAEIGARQDVPASTVRTRLSRGLDTLRRALDSEDGGDGKAWRLALAPLLANGGGAGDGESASASTKSASKPAWLRPLVVGAVALLVTVAFVALSSDDDPAQRPGDGSGVDVADGTSDSRPNDDAGRARHGGRKRSTTPLGGNDPAAGAPGGDEDPPKPDSTASAVEEPTAVIRVLSPEGKPVQGATVEMINPLRPGKIAYALVFFTTKTDENGDATVTAPLTETIGVRARFENQIAEVRRSVAAAEEQLQLTLQLGPTLTIQGRVTGRGDVPVVGARVTLGAVDHLAAVMHTKSDSKGAFRFEGLSTRVLEGEPSIYAEAAGHVFTELELKEPGPSVPPVLLRMPPAILVKGRCVDADGKPIQDVHVTAERTDSASSTGKDGAFIVRRVPLDGVEIDFQCMSHAALRLVPENVDLSDPDLREIDLGDVVLSEGGTIRGVVVDKDGTPVPKATIHLESLLVSQFVGQCQTDADGRFEMPRVGKGGHNLWAEGPSSGKRWASGAKGNAKDVKAGTEGLRIVVSLGHSLHVELFDGKTGEPATVKSVKVKLVDPAAPEGTKPKESGYWSDGMTSVRVAMDTLGPFDVTIEVPGYEPFVKRGVLLRADDETPLRVELARAK